MDKLHEESRKYFECWRRKFIGALVNLDRDNKTGNYVCIGTWTAWEAWQASRASIVVELPDTDNYWNGTSGHEIFNHRQFAADTCDALRDTGLSIKG